MFMLNVSKIKICEINTKLQIINKAKYVIWFSHIKKLHSYEFWSRNGLYKTAIFSPKKESDINSFIKKR